jgi:hypothetical protein
MDKLSPQKYEDIVTHQGKGDYHMFYLQFKTNLQKSVKFTMTDCNFSLTGPDYRHISVFIFKPLKKLDSNSQFFVSIH